MKCHRIQGEKNILLKVIFLICLKLIVAQNEQPQIYSISTDITNFGSAQGSLLGGTVVYIKGINFSQNPSQNIITIGPYPCDLVSDGSTDTLLVCTTTPATDKTQLNALSTTVTVINGGSVTCSSCYFSYSFSMTPFLEQINPKSISGNSLIKIWGFHRITNPGDGRSPSASQIQNILIGGTTCSLLDIFQQDSINPNSRDVLTCTTFKNHQAGQYDFIEFVQAGKMFNSVRNFQLSLFTGKNYTQRIIAEITGMPYHQGGSLGQLIRLTGTGFTSNLASFTCRVAGEVCQVINVAVTSIIISIPPKSPSNTNLGMLPQDLSDSNVQQNSYLGSNGFRYTKYDITGMSNSLENWLTILQGSNSLVILENGLMTQISSTQEQVPSSYVQYWRGYFVAQNSGTYRFAGLADDAFILKFSEVQNNSNILNLQTLIYQNTISVSHFLPYSTGQSSTQANKTLVTGYYYMQVVSVNYAGKGFFKLIVDIPQNGNCINPTWQVDQVHLIQKNLIPQILTVYVNNTKLTAASITQFDLTYTNIASGATNTYKCMFNLGDSAQIFQGRLAASSLSLINGYNSTVTLQTVTDSHSIITGYIYAITIQYYRSTNPIPTSSVSGVTILRTQNHSAPISNTFSIKLNTQLLSVYDPSTNTFSTNIAYNFNSIYLENALNSYYNTTQITISWQQNIAQVDNISFFIQYVGLYETPKVIQIQTSSLRGGPDNLFFDTSYTVRWYSKRPLYSPISYQLLRTAQSSPQIQLTTNSIPIFCQDCSYTYNSGLNAVVNSATLSNTVYTISVTDIGHVGFALSDISVYLLGVQCLTLTGSISSFTCNFNTNSHGNAALPAGSAVPQVHIAQIGYADVSSISPLYISMIVNNLTPSVVGKNGGVMATLTGTGFPIDATAQFTITLCHNQVIDFISVSNEQITFIIPPAETSCSGLTASQIAFSGQTVALTFSYDDTLTPKVTSLSIQSACPILTTSIIIYGTSFSALSNTQVFLTQNGKQIYQLQISSFSSTEIHCLLGGGKTGTYNVQIYDLTKGSSPPNVNNQFKYQMVVTSISLVSGGLGGGYSLTISGYNFASKDSMIVYIGPQKSSVCQIVSSTLNSIICTVPRLNSKYTSDTSYNIIVTARLFQQSVCLGNCAFTYDSSSLKTNYVSIPNILNYNAGEVVTIVGDDLTGATVLIQGQIVNVTYENTTSISFIYPILTAGDNYEILITTNKGYNYPAIITNTKIWLSNNISSNQGSTEGQILTVSGNGLAQNIQNPLLNVYSICPSKTTQLTVIQAVPNLITFQMIPMVADGRCAINVTYGTVYKVYSYSYNFSQTPSVNVVRSSNVFTATKVNLTSMTFDYAIFQFLDSLSNPTDSIYSAQITLINSTASTITPVGGYLPNGNFILRIHTTLLGYSVVNPTIFTNSWTTNPSVTQITSSFIGGQNVNIHGSGFLTISAQNNEVKVCGIRAIIQSATESLLKIKTPPLATIITQTLYNLAKSKIITGSLISDTVQNSQYIIDGKVESFYSSDNNFCFIGLHFGLNSFANISSIKFMPNPNWDYSANYLEGAVFQGSNDSSTWTTIFQIDTTKVHSGWNFWLPSSLVQYSYIRFSHNSTSKCQLSDFVFEGIVYSTQIVTSGVNKQCDIVINAPTNDITLTNSVIYSHLATAIINNISPSFASTAGGTTLTLTGINFGSSIIVLIDGVNCLISSQSSTQIKCITGMRNAPPTQGNSFIVTSDGNNVLLNTQSFLYVNRWSDQTTWKSESYPRQGDSVYIPLGMTLLVDVASTPIIGPMTIQGRIKFSDEIQMNLDFSSITINNGYFQAGTQTNRYQNKLTITLHGQYNDDQLPLFGNKGIGCLNCKFNLHGKVRKPTWTLIANIINIGDTTFTVVQPVDWQVGQIIVIAATSFDHYESQQKTILAVSGDKLTITVVEPFKFKHYSAVQTHAGTGIPMRAEVGLLTRNILIKGDDQSQENRYGSHLMITGQRDQGLEASISYTQFTKCGQPSRIGRYCTHFHMTQQMPYSSITGISVHHSYARVLTIHGTHFLTVQNNVGYYVEGHNIFIQDGIQMNNVIQDNLMISSITSVTLLQSDISVASYWITNPSNYFRRNHAAGSDFYGIWYEVKQHPNGPSAASDVCPMGMSILESSDNVAHSNMRFGLRIFKLASMKFPCSPSFDETLIDPFTSNIAIQAIFDNYTLWSNSQSGFLGEQLGYTTLNNFKTVDNQKAGIQFYKTNITKQFVIAKNSIIVGFSTGNAPANLLTFYDSTRGVIAPRTDGLLVSNVSFVNFGTTMTPLQSCSQCWNSKLWITGGKTTYFQKINFVNITGNYLYWQLWRRQIFIDLDGTLLAPLVSQYQPSISPQTFGSITPYIPSLMVPNHCYNIVASSWDQSIYCDQTINLRSILFTNAVPFSKFKNQNIKVVLLQDPYQNLTLQNIPNSDYTSSPQIKINQRSNDLPYSWALAFAVNQTYNIHWGNDLDFTHMSVAPSGLWNETEAVILRFNNTEYRQLYQIGKWYQQSLQLPYITKKTEMIDVQTCSNGDYYNALQDNYLFLCVSGRNKTARQWIDINGIKCLNYCPPDQPVQGKQNFQRIWSNATQWPGQVLPIQGDNIIVPYGWNLVLDIDPPVLNYVQIQGNLIFDRSRDNKFQAHYIWCQGNITIGSADNPFLNKAIIILHGEMNDQNIYVDDYAFGNKILVNTGGLYFFGNPPKKVWTRLTNIAPVGATSITVQDDITGWKVGDQIVIAPSYDGQTQFEQVQITSISGKKITFIPALSFQHYGDSSFTISNNYGVLDARSSVGLLTRNIKITRNINQANWGCRVLNYGYFQLPPDLTYDEIQLKNGYLKWNGVQLDGCGQINTQYAGLRIDKIGFNNPIELSSTMQALYNGYETTQINSSSIHSCYGICTWITNSTNITFNNNIFYNAIKYLVFVKYVNEFNFTNNLLIGAQLKNGVDLSKTVYDVSAYEQYLPIDFINGHVSVMNNLVQGSQGQGFVFPFTTCDLLKNYNFVNNIAGSSKIGFMFNTQYSGQTCLAISSVIVYACEVGVMANPNGPYSKILYQNLFLADNHLGISLRYGYDSDDNTINIQNSFFIGMSRPNCLNCYTAQKLSYCKSGYAVSMFTATSIGQQFPLIVNAFSFDAVSSRESFDSKSFFTNVTFKNYYFNNPIIEYCSGMSVFRRHIDASNSIGSAYLTNSQCLNCQITAWAYFDKPNPAWLGWNGGCGSFQCTGSYNYFIYDQDGSFTGVPSQILANNEIGSNDSSCIEIQQINGYYCKSVNLAVLEYQSLALDFKSRVVWPVQIFYDEGNWTTITNGWKRQKSSNYRLSRFWSVIQLYKTYNLTYSSSPPSDSIFQIQKRLQPKGNTKDWAIIRIKYSIPSSIQILVKNSSGVDIVIAPFPIIQNIPTNLSLFSNVCGANNFHYYNGTIQFVVNGVQNCQVRVRVSSYATLNIVLNIPIADFVLSIFVTNICTFLGIQNDRLKVLAINSGSTKIYAVIQTTAVDLNISTITSTSLSDVQANLQALSNNAIKGINNGNINLGGQVIQASSQVVVLNIDGSKYSSEQKSSFLLIILLSTILPAFFIIITIGIIWYCKRRSQKISGGQILSDISVDSNELKQFKRQTNKGQKGVLYIEQYGD